MSALLRLRTVEGPLVDIAKFRAQGFVVAKGVLDVGELESLLAEIDELFAIQLRRMGLSATPGGSREVFHANAQRLLAADVSAYMAAIRQAQDLPSVQALMVSEPILRIAGELGLEVPTMGAPTGCHVASDQLKIPGARRVTAARQDWPAHQGSLDSIGLWIALTPINVRSHPFEVAPRSHLDGLQPDPQIDEDMFAPLPMQRGDVIVYSTFLVRRISNKGDGQVRVALSGGLNNAAEPFYAARGHAASGVDGETIRRQPTKSDLAAIYPAMQD